MRTKSSLGLGGVVVVGLVIGVQAARDDPAGGPAREAAAAARAQPRDADREAVEKSSREFVKAFEKGDARAIAALWTADGEYQAGNGSPVRGRANIEKLFADHFKEQPKAKVDLLIDSVRFPAPDLAIEEGVVRQTSEGKELPSTTLYSTTHVRDKDGWKIAVSREWGAGQDRLEDLAWLVGQWKAALPDQEVVLSFSRADTKPFLVGQFTRKAKDKVVSSGTMRIGLDPRRGQLRSWHFDDDGGHGQALWIRDGSNWVLDSIGVLGDGTETASVNILGRVNHNEITWRSIDRVIGDKPVPDTTPIKLRRVVEGKN